jgi:membrane protease YdiL (CAAX protease family)
MAKKRSPELHDEGPGYFHESKSFATSIVSMLPLVVIYHCGIVQSGYAQRNMAELWLAGPLRLIGLEAASVLNIILIVALVAVLWRGDRASSFHWLVLPAMVAEGAFYAAALYRGGPVVAGALDERASRVLFAIGLEHAAPLLLALGAGVYEELFFRLLLIGGGAWVLHRLCGWGRIWSAGVMLVASSVLFSLVHYMGPLGEPVRTYSFLFRTVCGLLLGVVFLTRGLGVAVWTHATYNAMALLLYAGG